MIICPNCNNQLPDDAASCSFCGVQFISEDENFDYSTAETTVLSEANNPMRQNTAQAAQHPQQGVPQAQPYQNLGQAQSMPNFGQTGKNGQYGMPPYSAGPAAQLKTNRSFLKVLLLSLVTFGIYAIVCYGHITDDVNLVCSRYDGRKTMNFYLLSLVVAPITCGIASIVWMHNICDRIGRELNRRQLGYSFGSQDFWLWGVLGSLILVGPFIFVHKFFKAVNMMNDSYNKIG